QGARLRLEIDPHHGGLAPCVGKERERARSERPLDRGGLAGAGDVHPGDVARVRTLGVPADAEAFGGGRGRSGEEQGGDGRRGETRGARHSGRCCRRNCSISSTSSEAGGRSLVAGSASAASAASRDSSLAT